MASMLKAIAVLSGDTGAKGTLIFEQQAATLDAEPAADTNGSTAGTQVVKIKGEIRGLPPGKHGMHIHEFGDSSNGCTSAGDHFNPFLKNHGAQDSDDRHVGDLGNIIVRADGVAKINITDSQISLAPGERCVLGRIIVVHDDEDDLGLGGDKDSIEAGNAGGRACCGVIGMTSAVSDPNTQGALKELALHKDAKQKLSRKTASVKPTTITTEENDEDEDEDVAGEAEDEDEDSDVDDEDYGESDEDGDEEYGKGKKRPAKTTTSSKSSAGRGRPAKAPRRAAAR